MKKTVELKFQSNTSQHWGNVMKEKSNDEIFHFHETAFTTPEKNLSSSAVDLICGGPSRPCSG